MSTHSSTSSTAVQPPQQPLVERLEAFIGPILEPLGYDVVHVELEMHRNKVLRLFIDQLDSSKGIGVEDCVKATRALDEPLESISASDPWLNSEYELEVSSPGIDRPLRRPKDFIRFTGRETRLTTLRPLSSDELQNEGYAKRNPKQKNFIGEIAGFDGGSILLKVSASMGVSKSQSQPKEKKKGTKKPAAAAPSDLIHLPLSLVAKANLEPDFSVVNTTGAEIENT